MPVYNPAQQRVIELLGRRRRRADLPGRPRRPPAGRARGRRRTAGRPPPAEAVGQQARAERRARLRGPPPRPGRRLRLERAHGPGPGGAQGHRAGRNWRGEPVPGDLVDEALARLADGDVGVGRFLAGLAEADRAQLRGEATDLVTKFQECFPPLQSRGGRSPRAGSTSTCSTARVVLSGKVDLTLGKHRAGPRHQGHHRPEVGVPGPPPRRPALLRPASRRCASASRPGCWPATTSTRPGPARGGHRPAPGGGPGPGHRRRPPMVELRNGREPAVRPGPSCRWCPIAATCAEGQSWLWSADEGGGDT